MTLTSNVGQLAFACCSGSVLDRAIDGMTLRNDSVSGLDLLTPVRAPNVAGFATPTSSVPPPIDLAALSGAPGLKAAPSSAQVVRKGPLLYKAARLPLLLQVEKAPVLYKAARLTLFL